MKRAVIGVLMVSMLGGCGSSTVVTSDEPVATPYDGPMSQPQSYEDKATVLERSGAAARALECSGKPYDGGGGDYADGGLTTVQDSAAEALEDYLEEEGGFSWLPTAGYRVEREDDDRVLFSYDVDEQTKVAFIAADGIRDYSDEVGWGIESWSQCDPAELPSDVTDDLGLGVWEDASGQRQPIARILSTRGPEHCDWDDITFLRVGPADNADQYLRDTKDELRESLRTTFDPSAELPRTARDTGLHRDGRQLWLDPGRAAYLVSIENPDDVERWPAAKPPGIYCA